MTGRTYSTAEVAQLLCGDSMKSPERWLVRQITTGRIQAMKIGRKWRLNDDQLAQAELVFANQVAEPAEPAAPTGRPSTASLRRRIAGEVA